MRLCQIINCFARRQERGRVDVAGRLAEVGLGRAIVGCRDGRVAKDSVTLGTRDKVFLSPTISLKGEIADRNI